MDLHGETRIGEIVADRLTPDRVDTLRRIEALRPIGQFGELRPGRPESIHVIVEGGHMALEKRCHMFTGGLTAASEVEDRVDLGERQSGRLGITNEGQTLHRLVPVVPIAAEGSAPVGSGPIVAASSLCTMPTSA